MYRTSEKYAVCCCMHLFFLAALKIRHEDTSIWCFQRIGVINTSKSLGILINVLKA